MNHYHLDDYQEEADGTALESARDLNYLIPGLVAEAGEVAGKYAKAVRDDGGFVSVEREDAIIKELGDVLWFVALIATHLDVDLSEIATQNIEKLTSRKERGVIGGDGDNR